MSIADENGQVLGSCIGGEEGESNGFIHVYSSSVDADSQSQAQDIAHGFQLPLSLDLARMADHSLDQGKKSLTDEEMFVDCPEELVPNDGKNVAPENSEAAEILGTPQGLEEKDEVLKTPVYEFSSEANSNDNMIQELQHLRDLLATTVHEKESFARNFEEERRLYSKTFADLHRQLTTLTQTESSVAGIREYEMQGFLSPSSLDEMANECSNLIKHTLAQRSETAGMIGEHQAVLSTKDQEIEYLNARVSELSASIDVLEGTTNRILGSLGYSVNDMYDSSVTGKLSYVENGVLILIQNYSQFVSESDLLRECLKEIKPNFSEQDISQTVFIAAREELLELKRKEDEFLHQLEKERDIAVKKNAEIQKLMADVEQEKTRSGNVKEKLSLAVTKGKALVQQRDGLKQALASKSSELEQCLVELQEKSTAFKAVELRKEELSMLEDSLKESLAEKTSELERCLIQLQEKSTALEAAEISAGDLIRLQNSLQQSLEEKERELENISVKLEESSTVLDELIKSRAFAASLQEALSEKDSMIEACKAILSTEELQSNDLTESIPRLVESLRSSREEVVQIRAAAESKINNLTASLLSEMLEKSYLLEDFQDIGEKVAPSVEVENQVEQEKNRAFVRIQSHLYVSVVELALHRTELNSLSADLTMVSQEFSALKEEKVTLQNYLERSEEKAALLREKLSMAVKKGKGLVQDRENLKQSLKEKSAEIEKLKLDLEQRALENSKLSADTERIANLEADFGTMKEERDNFERFLVESNGMLQRVMESIDGIHLQVEFDEPVEKIKWVAGYLSECEVSKKQLEQDLEKVKENSATLAANLEDSIAKLEEEKREVEVSKGMLEQDLQRLTEEVKDQISKLGDVSASKKSLEEALLQSESNISLLVNEKESAQVSRDAAEMEVQRLKEEVSVHSSKLSDAQNTIQSLQDSISVLQTNLSALTEENHNAQLNRTSLESEIKKLQEDVESQASKFADASSTVKSLEDNLSSLMNEKSNYENEIRTLNSRLSACLEELSGTHGNLENRSLELSNHSQSLQSLLKDDTLYSLLKQKFEKELGSLKDMDDVLKDIWNHFSEVHSDILQNSPPLKEKISTSDHLHFNFDSAELVNGEVNAADGDGIMSYIGKTIEELRMKNKFLQDKFQSSSSFVDELIAALLTNLQATKEQMFVVLEKNKSMKQSLINMKETEDARNKTIAELENSITILVSGCAEATRELDSKVENNLLKSGLNPSLDNINLEFSDSDNSKYVEATNKLLSATRNVDNLIQKFEGSKNAMAVTMENLEARLQETTTNCEKAVKERDLTQHKVMQLETEIKDMQNLCREMKVTVADYRAKEDQLKEREAELESTYSTIKKDNDDLEESFLSATQMKSLFDKINGVEIPPEEFEGDTETNDSIHVRKLFYIIESVKILKNQMTSLSREKENLQLAIEDQDLEIEHLKEEAEEQMKNRQDYEKLKKELSEVAVGLESIIQKLGREESFEIAKSGSAVGLVPLLEKLVMNVNMESENLKSKSQELSGKLIGTQRVIEELSSKIKQLEDSSHVRDTSLERDRGGFESTSLSTRSEISEIEDVGASGNKGIPPPVGSAAHVRTMRKGSSDHLTINIDSESDRFIPDTTLDKGHMFKSLTTSGLVPRQGKIMADRVDGIWVSGGRALMSRPRARLGLIAYWLILHIWLFGTIIL